MTNTRKRAVPSDDVPFKKEMDAILEDVGRLYDVPPASIRSHSRAGILPKARKKFGMTALAIGYHYTYVAQYLGMDRTTAYYWTRDSPEDRETFSRRVITRNIADVAMKSIAEASGLDEETLRSAKKTGDMHNLARLAFKAICNHVGYTEAFIRSCIGLKVSSVHAGSRLSKWMQLHDSLMTMDQMGADTYRFLFNKAKADIEDHIKVVRKEKRDSMPKGMRSMVYAGLAHKNYVGKCICDIEPNNLHRKRRSVSEKDTGATKAIREADRRARHARYPTSNRL